MSQKVFGYSHSFDVRIAKITGSLEAALLFNHIVFWVVHNKAHEKNLIEGRTWTFQTLSQIAKQLDYLSEKQIKYALAKLVDQGFIIKGKFNKSAFDHTPWYALPDESILGYSNNSYVGTNLSQRQDTSVPTTSQNCPDYIGEDTKKKILKEDTKVILSEHAFGLASFFLSLLKNNNPSIKEPNLEAWAKELDRMIRIDKRDSQEIRHLMTWATADPFWHKNILSPANLRKHFDRLLLESTQKRSEPFKGRNATYTPPTPEQAQEEDLKREIKPAEPMPLDQRLSNMKLWFPDAEWLERTEKIKKSYEKEVKEYEKRWNVKLT